AGQAQPPGKSPFGQPNPPEKARWEYAELYYRSTLPPAKDNEERPQPSVTIRWTTDKDEVTFNGWAEFSEKAKANLKKDASATHLRVQLLNHFGNEGWELVESTSSTAAFNPRGTSATSGTRTMLFKRRVR
ncbi:MAG TPA: hypothetical protein VD866_11405, partial [Urbifossiella sp.]|nr:hypothetical protein [Urbifossiella sp.]